MPQEEVRNHLDIIEEDTSQTKKPLQSVLPSRSIIGTSNQPNILSIHPTQDK